MKDISPKAANSDSSDDEPNPTASATPESDVAQKDSPTPESPAQPSEVSDAATSAVTAADSSGGGAPEEVSEVAGAASAAPASEKTAAESEKTAAQHDPWNQPLAGAGGHPAPMRRTSRARTILVAGVLPAVAVIAIAAIAVACVLGVKLDNRNDALRDRADVDAASQAALTAASAYAIALTSVDSNNLDKDFTAVLDGSTGEFKDMYTKSSGRLRQLLMENKATGKGTVMDAAVKSATTTKVEVLLFIDQTVTNTTSADPRVDRSRVEMTMERVNDRWLASRVFLP